MIRLLFIFFLSLSLLCPRPVFSADEINVPMWIGTNIWDWVDEENCKKMNWEWQDDTHEYGAECILPDDIESLIVQAIESGDIEKIRAYLDAGMPVDYGPEQFYYVPLSVHAYGAERCDILDLLIERGADKEKLRFFTDTHVKKRCPF